MNIRKGYQEFVGEVVMTGQDVLVLPAGAEIGTLYMPNIPGYTFWKKEAERRAAQIPRLVERE